MAPKLKRLRVAALLIVSCLAASHAEAAPIVTHRLIESGSATFVQSDNPDWLSGSFSVTGPGFIFTGQNIWRSHERLHFHSEVNELGGTLLLDGQQRNYWFGNAGAGGAVLKLYYEPYPTEPAPGVIVEIHRRFEAIGFVFDPVPPWGPLDFSAYGAGDGNDTIHGEGGGGHVRYVDARFDFQPVPEPTTMVSMGLGLVLLAGFGSWSRKKRS